MSTTTRSKLFLIICLLVALNDIVHVESTTTVTATETLTSCTNQPLLPELPNLSHVKLYQKITVPTVTCNTTDVIAVNQTYTWYYHSVYPPLGCPENQCCFDTKTSVIAYTSFVRDSTNGNRIVSKSGSIIQGAFLGQNVTGIVTMPIANQNACLSDPGLVIDAGTETLTIVDGPTCSGIVMVEVCPGIHFG